MVRPIANAEDSTAEVYLRGQGLPDLDRWPEQLAEWANRSYDFRGVEVTLAGTVREQDGTLVLTGPTLGGPVRLAPLGQGMKIQWDHQARRPRDATDEEMSAYRNLLQARQDPAGGEAPVRLTGPLGRGRMPASEVRVRSFEPMESSP